MGIKQKLLLMGVLMALLVVAICGIGYHQAQTALEESVSGEINAALTVEAEKLDGWMSRKIQRVESAANLVASLDGNPIEMDPAVMSLAIGDKDVIDLAYGAEDARFISWSDGNLTGEFNPLDRPWYTDAKAAGKTIVTSAYQDAISKKMVVSVAVPYNGADGKFRGVVISDVSLDALGERVNALKFHGAGAGIIVEQDGLIIASTEGMTMHNATENPVLKERLPEMQQKKNGYFAMEKDGEQQIIAYATAPSTGWIVAIAVPESVQRDIGDDNTAEFAIRPVIGDGDGDDHLLGDGILIGGGDNGLVRCLCARVPRTIQRVELAREVAVAPTDKARVLRTVGKVDHVLVADGETHDGRIHLDRVAVK